MKEFKFEVEFLQPALANGGREDDECRFPRTSDGKLVFQDAWWHSAITAALMNMADMEHVHPSDIHIDLEIEAETRMFARRFNGDQTRVHESIPAGARVKLSALTSQHVAEADLRAVMDRLGRFVGISPFGHRLGYGKFKLVEACRG